MAGAVILSSYKDPKSVNVNTTTPTSPTIEVPSPSSNSDNTTSTTKILSTNVSKRTPKKVYHRFEDIPEIKDDEAHLYSKDEYTYVINQDQYQKDGSIELKRVLKKETTKANALSLMYRTECHTYTPSAHEDQLTRYVIDINLISKTGKYKGPSQMDDQAITNFIKFLASSPKYKEYIYPIIKNSPEELQKIENKFYNKDGSIRSMEVREMLVSLPSYQNIKINTSAWEKIASNKTKKYISKTENNLSPANSKLTNTTKTYFCLTDLFPDTETLIKALEEYNLSSFTLNRQGKPKHILAALALSLNYKDEHGNLDATRLPTYAISASISHVNWQGNGRSALKDAQTYRSSLQENPNNLKKLVKNWITGKGNEYGVDEISKLNLITDEIVEQYLCMELPGSKNFAQKYRNAIKQKEDELKQFQQKQQEENIAQNSTSNKPTIKALYLSIKDFIQTR